MNDLTLLVCSYNTPGVTVNMLRSFALLHEPGQRLLVSENSTNEDTCRALDGVGIKYYRNPGMMHAPGMNFLFDRCETRHALLLDTDVLFKKNVEPLYKIFVDNDMALCGEYNGDRGGKKLYPRIAPWFCFVDMTKIRANRVPFEDTVRFKANVSDPKATRKYDVGCTMYEDLEKLGFKIGATSGSGGYYVHYEGMSWRIEWFERKLCTDKALYKIAQRVEKQYIKDTEYLRDVKLKDYYVTKNE